ALVGAARRSRRLPPPGRGRRAARQLARGLRRRVEASPGPPGVQPRPPRLDRGEQSEGRLMGTTATPRTWDRIDEPDNRNSDGVATHGAPGRNELVIDRI